MVDKVSINPGIGILTLLKSMNYKVWFALSEFIDNSISSYIKNKKELEKVEGSNFKLDIQINFSNDKTITITDNAAGINEIDFKRAFKPASIPPDAKGLNEFGMGMKSASMWFTDEWEVRSSALGEDIERTVIFDQKKVQKDKIEELEVFKQPAQKNYHKTEITLRNVDKWPGGQTKLKIKRHLSSIYRKLFISNKIQLFIDDEEIKYTEPEILIEPVYSNNGIPVDKKNIKWELNDISIDLGDNKIIEGRVFIRKKGSVNTNGMSYFRRGRLIIGSDDDAYKPESLYGKINTFRKQRLTCEFNLKGFSVTHTKDGIHWGNKEDDLEEIFFEKLLNVLKNAKINGVKVDFIKQCENYRANYIDESKQADLEDFIKEESKRASKLEINTLPNNDEDNIENFDLVLNDEKKDIPYHLRVGNEEWNVLVRMDWNETGGINWFSVTREHDVHEEQPYKMGVKLNLKHPFYVNFASATGTKSLRPITRIIVAFVVAEAIVKSTGNNQILIRRKMVELVNSMTESKG